jgi:hypothetical protein
MGIFLVLAEAGIITKKSLDFLIFDELIRLIQDILANIWKSFYLSVIHGMYNRK